MSSFIARNRACCFSQTAWIALTVVHVA
jgi:hypothetical protein